MNVKLVSLTHSLVDDAEKVLSPEELIVYIARVSNPSNQLNTETSDKLIAYLIRNKHWSPFEMVDMTVEIVTSRGIAQQILRHRSFSFQEFSQRYAAITDMEPIQIRRAGSTTRQGSAEGDYDPILEPGSHYAGEKVKRAIADYIRTGTELYKAMLEADVAKECARFVLPITTQTKIYMKGSVRSWVHYLQIRCDAHTQLEHRQIALAILEIVRANFPNLVKALEL